MTRSFKVKARRPQREYENQRFWMEVGMATEMEDGTILMTLNALPFEFDGELKLFDRDRDKKSYSNND